MAYWVKDYYDYERLYPQVVEQLKSLRRPLELNINNELVMLWIREDIDNNAGGFEIVCDFSEIGLLIANLFDTSVSVRDSQKAVRELVGKHVMSELCDMYELVEAHMQLEDKLNERSLEPRNRRHVTGAAYDFN